MNTIRLAPMFLLAALAACSNSSNVGSSSTTTPPPSGEIPTTSTPKAVCGPGSKPETSYQGRVTQDDHDSGRAAEGFTCNTELVGSYLVPNQAGTVGGFKVERYVDAAGHDCAYYDTTLLWPTNIWGMDVGVNVMDMSDPTHPALVDQLLTPAMQSPHESLILSKERGVLAAVAGNPAAYPGVVDVYDISGDCRHPALKASAPVGFLGHESGMALDGMTFYSASPGTPTLTAVDISNELLPIPLATANIKSHGLSISDDGNRAYVADATGKQLVILDVSDIQSRKTNPAMRTVATLSWSTVSIPQNAIPITIHGHPYLVEIDEYGANKQVGAGRIIDIADETHPSVVSNLRLEVHDPAHFGEIANDPGASNTLVGGYAGHYCNVPTRHDPGIVACSMILSGLRVFDIHDPANPREIAYFNAPVRDRINPLPAPASNWAMSSPAFVPERKEIWYSDGYNGFYVVRVTNGAWQ